MNNLMNEFPAASTFKPHAAHRQRYDRHPAAVILKGPV